MPYAFWGGRCTSTYQIIRPRSCIISIPAQQAHAEGGPIDRDRIVAAIFTPYVASSCLPALSRRMYTTGNGGDYLLHDLVKNDYRTASSTQHPPPYNPGRSPGPASSAGGHPALPVQLPEALPGPLPAPPIRPSRPATTARRHAL